MRTRPLWACVGAVALAAAAFPQEPAKDDKPQKAAPAGKKDDKEAEKRPPRKRVTSDLSGFELIDSARLKGQPMVVGGTRSLTAPVALAPQLGKLAGPSPVFAWSYGYRVPRFRFTLRGAADEPVFQAEATGTRYRYPGDAPALETGRTYSWTVEPLGAPGRPSPSSPVAFTVEPGVLAALAKLGAAGGFEAGLARARLLTEHRLWYDAVEAYSDLIARFPERAEPYEERGAIYGQLEVTEALAEEDLARADALRAREPRR